MSSTILVPHAEQLPSRAIDIVAVTSAALSAMTADLQVVLKAAFDGATFHAGFGPDSPWEHTASVLDGSCPDCFRHVLAVDADKALVGAVLCVPSRMRGDDAGDPGWFFISPAVSRDLRSAVAAGLVDTAHQIMRDASLTRVVTKMGTASGSAYLVRHHGYRKEPSQGQENRYVLEL